MDYFFQYIFSGLATLVTGMVAWLVYLYNKRDRKIEIATIILNDIVAAEREIHNIRTNKVVNDYTYILPVNHWEESQHIFIKNFDSDELSRISNFFKICSLTEESLKLMRSYLPIAMEQKVRVTQDKLIELASNTNDKSEYASKKSKVLGVFEPEDYWFSPNTPRLNLINFLQDVEQLSLSSIGTKFKIIRDTKWFKIRV